MEWRNFSFVIPKRLAGMSHPGIGSHLQETMDILKNSKGIQAIITLTERGLSEDVLRSNSMEYLHLPVRDFSVPEVEQADELVEFINRMNQQKKAVVVHCQAGQGRTGTMLACYLVSLGIPPREAILQIRNFRPGSIETDEQEEFIYIYGQCCQQKNPSSPKE